MDFLTPHLPLLRFHVGGYGDQTQDCCDFDISQTVLYNHSATSHPQLDRSPSHSARSHSNSATASGKYNNE